MRCLAVATVALALAACRGPGTMKVTCTEGRTDCDGICVDLNNDSKHCGACNRACAANEQCSMGTCQPICGAGMHACNGVCVSNNSVQTCGSMCTPCPQPAGSLATCDGTKCGLICEPTLRPCGGACATCPMTSGGVKCNGTMCVTSGCPKGQHLCNGECVDENGGSCGEACLACPAPPSNGFAVCLNGGCEFLCRPGNRSCATGCCAADFIEVGAFHSCRLTPAGAINCWGRNSVTPMTGGQLGDGTYIDRSQPVPVQMLTTGIVAVQLGAFHSCAMNQFGAVFCWGSAQGGRLGDGTMSDKLVPTPVSGLGQGAAIAIAAGDTGACALSRSGELRCWGENLHGEVGDGTKSPRTTPVLLGDLGTSVIDVAFGGDHACALLRGGTVRCWGDNSRGQLGDGTRDERTRPTPVMGLTGVTRIFAGERHSCALRGGGEVWCWGDNMDGQIGPPATDVFRTAPARVDGLSNVTELAAGGSHTCALVSGGQVQCWGFNSDGQLGDGTNIGRPQPMPVSGLSDGTSISAGRLHTCARTQSGTRCWGDNEFGQLGDGTQMDRNTPVNAQ